MFARLRTVFITAFVVLFFFTGACAPAKDAKPSDPATPAATSGSKPATPAVAPGYKIGPGDVLRISVWKEEGMEQEILVKPGGGITFPLAGDIQASGLTTQELAAVLKSKLKRYIPNPVVTVSVLQAVSNKIYVVGKVNQPGEYQATHYMDVLQALSLAGGLTPYADSDEIKVIRRRGGKKQVFEFDYDRVISGRQLDMNILLEAGDTVVVP
jgi:polysaccharide export outer membrane protein